MMSWGTVANAVKQHLIIEKNNVHVSCELKRKTGQSRLTAKIQNKMLLLKTYSSHQKPEIPYIQIIHKHKTKQA